MPFFTYRKWCEAHKYEVGNVPMKRVAEPGSNEADDDSFSHEVDLIDFDSELQKAGIESIFTKDRILQVKKQRSEVETQHMQTTEDIYGKTRVIWKKGKFSLNYLNYVELSPAYKPNEPSSNIQQLRHYNRDNSSSPDDIEKIKVPIFIAPTPNRFEHFDQSEFGEWTFIMDKSLEPMWHNSTSKKLLFEKFSSPPPDPEAVQIRKIVCFGFGQLNLADDRQSIGTCCDPLQYLAAFTIAEALLNSSASEASKEDTSFEIVFQDPCYQELDRKFWASRAPDGVSVKFVDDPDGLLEVDEHTLVMSAYITLCVPLMQIIADLVPGGPAGWIIDRVPRDAEKRMWSVSDRGSPRVVSMLEGYETSDFQAYDIEEAMHGLVYHQGKPVGKWRKTYWLWWMECHLKTKKVDTGKGEKTVRRSSRIEKSRSRSSSRGSSKACASVARLSL